MYRFAYRLYRCNYFEVNLVDYLYYTKIPLIMEITKGGFILK
jgi:hypothetical protein